MVIDTKSGLSPEVSQMFLRALTVDNHRVSGNLSATQLMSAPQIRMLKKQHKIDEELADRFWMLLGSAFHKVMEMSNMQESDSRAMMQVIEFFGREARKEGADQEMMKKAEAWLQSIFDKFFKDINSRFLYETNIFFELDGLTISCTYDMYDKQNKTIFDYKLTKTWGWIYEESRVKWGQQMNIYAYAMRVNGFEVKDAKIIGVFKDWSANEMLRNKNYPDFFIKEIPIIIQPQDVIETYLKERIRLHKLAEAGNIIPCSASDMWSKSNTYAVKVEGLKRALSGGIFDSLPMAESFVKQNSHKYPKGLHIETRSGGNTFCESYCAVRNVCPQHKTYLETLSKQSENA